jgi:hypothetical protein
MGVMTGSTTNILTFVRTLRSTGCSAAIVIFCDKQFMKVLNRRQEATLTKCGVNFINIGKLYSPYAQYLFETRHLLYYDFLKTYRSSFDRILILDIADTFFQIDPFTTDFGYRTMAVTSELVTLNDDEENNTQWIRIADPDYKSHKAFYNDRVALNAGFLYGSMEGWMHFYNTFLKLPMFEKFEIPTIDQGFMNYLYHRGHYANAGLNLTISHPGDYLLSVRGGEFDPKPNGNGLWKMKGTTVIPGAIHQYNRICPLMKGVHKSCPRKWFDKTAFAPIKDVSQKCSNRYVDTLLNVITIDRVTEITQKIHSKLPYVGDKKVNKTVWINK